MAAKILNRQIFCSAIITIVVVVALVVLWFVVLPPFIERQIIKALAAQGFSEADIHLSELALNHATLENLELGTELGFTIRTIQVRYNIASLLRSEVVSIVLIGVRSELSYQDHAWDLGPFASFVGASDSTADTKQALSLPFHRIILKDALIRLDWEGRELLLPLEAELNRSNEDEIEVQIRAYPDEASLRISGEANLDGLRGRAEIDISAQSEPMIHQLGVILLPEHPVSSSGELKITGEVRFRLEDEPFWHAQIQVTERDLELVTYLPDPPLELFLRHLSVDLQINYPGLTTVDLQTRINDTPLNIEGGFDSRSRVGSGRISIPECSESMLKTIADVCLPDPPLAIQGSVALNAEAEFTDDQLTGRIDFDGRRFALNTRIGSSVYRFTQPVIEADLHMQVDNTAAPTLSGEVNLRQLAAALTDTNMSIRVENATICMPLPQDTLSPLKGVVHLTNVTLEENQTGLRLEPPLVSGSFSALGNQAEFAISCSILPEALVLVSGTISGLGGDGQDKREMSGLIDVRIPPFSLEQTKPVYRRMTGMADVDLGGMLAANGRFELRGDSLIPWISIDVKDMWWEKPETESRIEGISGTVLIDQLSPLASDGDQELSWTRFTAGAFEATAGRARFRISSADTSITGSIECNWAEGRLWSDSIQIRPMASIVSGEIHLEKLSLQGILDFLDYEGVKGEGWIYGQLPIQVTYGDRPRVSFGDGVLKADPPQGRLQLSKETAMTILGITYEIDPATADKQEMARLLMLRALQDIEYSTLQVTCHDDSTAGWVTYIQIQGHGPYGDQENLVPIAGLNIEVSNLDDLLNSIILRGSQSGKLKFDG
jgi:hypothetical protein